jgi:hypothetical protein
MSRLACKLKEKRTNGQLRDRYVKRLQNAAEDSEKTLGHIWLISGTCNWVILTGKGTEINK